MTARLERKHPSIFVVGMRDDLHEPRRGSETQQFKALNGAMLVEYLTGLWGAEARELAFFLEQAAYHER